MERVLAAKLYFWLLVIHLVTFWKQTPWDFVIGLVRWPKYFCIGVAKKNQRDFVVSALNYYCESIESGEAINPPKCLMRRLLAVAGA